jgi:predicted permease
MDQLDKKPFEKPNMNIFVRILIAFIVATVIYQITGNFVIAGIVGFFLASPSKKKKKISVSPLFKNFPKIKTLETMMSDTAPKMSGNAPKAPVNDDPLGENQERERQRKAISILLIALGVGVFIYLVMQNTVSLKEIVEGLRTLE